MAARDTLRRVGAARGAACPVRNGSDICPFVPSVAIIYVVITSAIAFPSAAAVTGATFDENSD